MWKKCADDRPDTRTRCDQCGQILPLEGRYSVFNSAWFWLSVGNGLGLLIIFTGITLDDWLMQYNTDYTLLQIIKMEFASIWHMMHRIW